MKFSAPAPQQAPVHPQLRVTVEAASLVLTPLVTRLDAHQAVALRPALLDHIERGPRHLIVDLGYVEWMDSSALNVLVAAFQGTGRADGSFAVRALQPRIRAMFAQTRLDRVIPFNDPAPVIAVAPQRKRWTRLRWPRRELVTTEWRGWPFGVPAAEPRALPPA